MSRIRLENVAHDNNNMSLKEQKRKTNKHSNETNRRIHPNVK